MKKQDLEDLKAELNDVQETLNYTKIGVGLLLDIVIDSRKSCIKDLEGHPGFIPPGQITNLQDEIGRICGLQQKLFNIEDEQELPDEEKSACGGNCSCKAKEKPEEEKPKDEEK